MNILSWEVLRSLSLGKQPCDVVYICQSVTQKHDLSVWYSDHYIIWTELHLQSPFIMWFWNLLWFPLYQVSSLSLRLPTVCSLTIWWTLHTKMAKCGWNHYFQSDWLVAKQLQGAQVFISLSGKTTGMGKTSSWWFAWMTNRLCIIALVSCFHGTLIILPFKANDLWKLWVEWTDTISATAFYTNDQRYNSIYNWYSYKPMVDI